MKKVFNLSLLIILFLLVLLPINELRAQPMMHRMMDPQEYDYSDLSRWGRGMMSPGMMGYGMMGYGMMMGGMGCPTMSNYLGIVNLYIAFGEELDLSGTQMEKLERIREKYEEESLDQSTKLMEKMFKLNSLLRKDEIDLAEIEKVNNEIEEIQSGLRYNNIRGYVEARNVLNEEQRDYMKSIWFRGYQQERMPRRR